MKPEIKEKITATNQKYLKKFLTEEAPVKLESQLEHMDWSYLDMIHNKEQQRGTFSPLAAMELSEIEANKDKYLATGLDAVKNGKVGAILLAGGQGTRLGFDKAKGMFNIGKTKELYIFEQLVANLMKVTNQTGTWVPLYVMTSEINDSMTREFFEEHDYFGYNKDYVKFFVQEMVPAVDFDGNLLMKSEDSLAMSPNGNGGWFKSLINAGLDKDLKDKGVEWLNVFAVDNVLQQIADPVFVGATIESGCVSGSKVVRKCDPYERVGAMCLENGKPSIVEYYELTPEMAEAKNENGSLQYGFGVILNYLFRVELWPKQVVGKLRQLLVGHVLHQTAENLVHQVAVQQLFGCALAVAPALALAVLFAFAVRFRACIRLRDRRYPQRHVLTSLPARLNAF